MFKLYNHKFYRGFSQIDLAWNTSTRKLCAIKRIICHSDEDRNIANREAEYMRLFSHPNLVPLIGCESKAVKGHRSIMCEVLISMPFYKVSLLLQIIKFLRDHCILYWLL